MTELRRATSNVELIAALLSGSWRALPERFECSVEELETVAPLLLGTGAAALAWRRVSHLEIDASSLAAQLHDTYRLYKLLAVICERQIAEIFTLLRAQGIEPVMIKGWTIARHYGEAGLRPCGDIDLCLRPCDFAKARLVLDSYRGSTVSVDLHEGFRGLGEPEFEELMARSQLVELEGAQVRVLSHEDHLRVLCHHFLREGGWRPLWLCDIAAAVESCTPRFDWDLCLGKNKRRAHWIACTIELAHRLLGADVKDAPAFIKGAQLPRWFLPSVLKEWEVRSMSQRHRAPANGTFTHPLRTLRGLRYHWPTPVEATVLMGGPFNELPRLPFQVGDCFSRTARLLTRLPDLLRHER